MSVRQSTAFDPNAQAVTQGSFFDRERDRLIAEITSGFEEMLTDANVLNRKLEEVYGVGKEFSTVAQLWGRFNDLIREQQIESATQPEVGVPGTGGANYGSSTANR